MNKLYTVDQVKDMLGISPVTVRWRARKHGIGQKFGKAHAFTDADVERLAACPSPGRPRKESSAPGSGV